MRYEIVRVLETPFVSKRQQLPRISIWDCDHNKYRTRVQNVGFRIINHVVKTYAPDFDGRITSSMNWSSDGRGVGAPGFILKRKLAAFFPKKNIVIEIRKWQKPTPNQDSAYEKLFGAPEKKGILF